MTLTTPPLLSVIGAVVHRLRGVRFYIWEMDIYPDVAVDLGYIRKDSLLHKVTAICADWLAHRRTASSHWVSACETGL